MVGTLLKDGMEVTSDTTQADVVIVNTCSFIDSAQEESVDTILESAELRKASHRGQGLVVSGCLPQRFKDELPKLLPEVDAFMGVDQVTQVTEVVKQALARRAARLGERVKSEGRRPKAERSSEFPRSEGHVAPGRPTTFQPRPSFGFRPSAFGLCALALAGGYSSSPLHPRLRDAALPADAPAFCLCQDRRGLQPSLQFLHHPSHSGFAPEPCARGRCGRS